MEQQHALLTGLDRILTPGRVVSLAALCVVGLVAVVAVRALLWKRATAATIAQLRRSASNPAAYSPEQVAATPEPVRRYFAFALSRGQPLIRNATLRQQGDVSGTPVLTPWVGHFSEYERVNGVMIPRVGEVEWVLPEGQLPYWKGRITAAVFDHAR